MKKSLIPIILTFALGFASALSFGDILDKIDSSLIMLSAIFVIAFLIFRFSLSKIFQEQKNTATIVSAVLAFLIIFGINKLEWNIQNFFFDLGISEDALFTIIPLILIGGIIILFVKLPKKKKKYLFYILGGFLIAVGLLIFEQAAEILVMGIVLIVFGLIASPILKFIKTSLFGVGKKNKGNSTATTTS